MTESMADMVRAAKATITECTVEDARQCLDSDTVIIDVREPAEYQAGHIPGAVLLPLGSVESDVAALMERIRVDDDQPDTKRAVILYCGSGGRSALAAQCMEGMGYQDVHSMAGGVMAWGAAGLPLPMPVD